MKNFDYYQPKSAAQVTEVLTKVKGARLKAAGTDLAGILKEGLSPPSAIVNLLHVPEWRGIETTSKDLFKIGATATLTEIAEHDALGRWARAIVDAAKNTATPLIRNRATLGGNLCQRPRCWYFRNLDYHCSKKGGDTCYAAEGENKYHAIFDNVTCNIVHPSNLAPALWALDAIVHVLGPKGAKDIPIADFWVTPEEDIKTEIVLEADEIVTGVSFAPERPTSGSCYMEVQEKQSFDWALVSCAARMDMDGETVKDCRVVISAVAPVPLRREAAEAVLRGQKFSEELAWKAADKATEGATPLRDNAYKIPMLRAVVAHAIQEARKRSTAH